LRNWIRENLAEASKGMIMKRIVSIIFVIALVGSLPCASSAQLMAGNFRGGAPYPPRGGPTTTGCLSQCDTRFTVESYAAYFDDPKGFSYTRERADGSGEPNLIFTIPVRGVWFGASSTISLSEALGISASGGLLAASKTQGEFREEGPVQVPLNSNMDSDCQWGYIDGMAMYNISRGDFGAMQIVGGFRWDHFDSRHSIRFADATGANQLNGSATNNVIANAFLPYVGIQSVYKSGASKTTSRLIGFPYVPGEVKFQDSFTRTQNGLTENGGGEYRQPLTFDSGYFLEFFTEGSRRVLGAAYLGAFLRWSMLRAKTGMGRYSTANDQTGSSVINETFSYYLHSWAVGGSVSMDF
jgi:hypothetical protein